MTLRSRKKIHGKGWSYNLGLSLCEHSIFIVFTPPFRLWDPEGFVLPLRTAGERKEFAYMTEPLVHGGAASLRPRYDLDYF